MITNSLLHMIFKWPSFNPEKRKTPVLKAIFVATAAGAPMRSVDSAEAISQRGLQGDRYSEDKGHWQSIEGCQVTLISTHDLSQAKKATPPDFQKNLDHGNHRRNLVIDGLKTKKLEGKKFRIGAAVFSYEKIRPPCGYLDQVSGTGMCRALSHHSGVCIRVIRGGKIAVGDALEMMDQA